MTHIVMTGSDVSMYTHPEGNETLVRFKVYAAALPAGSKLTFIAIGAPKGSPPIVEGNLTIIPIASLWGLYGVLKELPAISLITTQTCTEESWVTYLFACPRHIPVIPQEHSDPFDIRSYNGPLWRRALLRLRHRLALSLLRFASGIRCVSPSAAEALKPYLKNKPIAVLPVPVSITPLPRAETDPRIFFIGRLDPQKNVEGLLQITARLAPDYPMLRLDIVGQGVLRPALEAQAKALGIGSIVTFHGQLTYGQLAGLFARATIFIAPSWYEGFGRVILEALICGVPVISSTTAGPSFIIGADKAGYLHEAGDIGGMTASARQLLESPALREEMRQRGYKTATRFSRAQMSQDWMDFLVALV